MNTPHDIARLIPWMNHRLALLGTLALPLSLLQAQSPCAPPSRLATQNPFTSTHYYSLPGQNNTSTPPIPQNLPANYRGFLCLFDLAASANVTVSQIDFSLVDDGFWRYHWGPAPGQAGGPGLIGQTAVVKVWTTPVSWAGLSTTPSAWTLLSTGTLTVAAHDQHSPAVFPTPFLLPAGTYGVAFEVGPVTATVPHITYANPPYALHPFLLVGSFLPGTPLTASDQFLSFSREDITSQAFVNAPGPQPKNPIFEVHYTVASNSAYTTKFGSGCYDRPKAFYEQFAETPAPFDLSNSAFRMVPANGSYVVTAVPSTIATPSTPPLMNASNLPMGDGDRTAAQPLGFTFNYPGGSTTSIVATSDGTVFLDPTTMGNQNHAASPRSFAMGTPMLAPFGTDLDPRDGGSIHFHVDPVAQAAYVTWLNIPAWDILGSANTFQVALFANGEIEYRYGACATTKDLTLVGFSPGWSSRVPEETDISAALPFVTGDGAVPPALSLSARPRIGTTPNLVIGDTPSGALGGMFLGGPRSPLELGFLGMPGCLQQIDPIDFQLFVATGTTGTLPLAIPSGPAFMGMQIIGQSLVISTGSNAMGGTVSNPLCINLGL